MAKLVSKVYGDALFEATREMERINETAEEVKVLLDILKKSPELLQLLNHPQVVKEEKLQIIGDIFEGKLSDEIMGFLTTVVEKGRQNEICSILEYFTDRVKEYHKTGTACVTSAVELSEEQKTQVRERLLATTSFREFEMHYDVDPSLIGGMIIRIGDRVADSSIKTRLYEMKRELLKVQMV